MSIVYALISREDASTAGGPSNIYVLTEVTDSNGNFPQVTRQVILRNVPKDEKSIYNYQNKYMFHTHNENGFTFLCLSDMEYSKVRAQQFLAEVKASFTEEVPDLQKINAIEFGLDNTFKPVIEKLISKYNDVSYDPKFDRIKNDAMQTLDIMEKNVESIMERGQKIEILVKKSNEVNVESNNLRSRANALKEKERSEGMKKKVIIGVAIVILLYILFA